MAELEDCQIVQLVSVFLNDITQKEERIERLQEIAKQRAATIFELGGKVDLQRESSPIGRMNKGEETADDRELARLAEIGRMVEAMSRGFQLRRCQNGWWEVTGYSERQLDPELADALKNAAARQEAAN
jgi:hypothetical protein